MINSFSTQTGSGLLAGFATFKSHAEAQSRIETAIQNHDNAKNNIRVEGAAESATKGQLSSQGSYVENLTARERVELEKMREHFRKHTGSDKFYFSYRSSSITGTDVGPIAFRDRGEAMQDSYSLVDQLFKDVKTLNTNRQGIIYQQNALEGKEVPDSFRHIRGYGPDGRLIIDYTRPIGDEMTEENIAYAHKAIANMNEIIGKTLTSIDQIGKALGDTFEIAGTLTKTNKDGTLGLGQFEIRHQDYGLLMASDGQGNVTMYDQNGTGKDPLSYVQGDAKLRDYYMSTTVDLRF